MRIFYTFWLSVAALVAAVSVSHADIERSCSASVFVTAPNGAQTKNFLLGDILGRGSCKNKAHANDCRERAREQVDKCIAAMWRDRHVNAIAPECKSLVSNSSRSGARLSWDGIMVISQPNRLTARMARGMCCKALPNAGKISVQLGGNITGDKKCGASKIGKDLYQSEFGLPRYDMDCGAWRAQGICK